MKVMLAKNTDNLPEMEGKGTGMLHIGTVEIGTQATEYLYQKMFS